ncbi:hypothetical protein BBI17_008016 [Phytophthora kernoviae]|uniref:Sugar transporter SWEET1 n=1 Tax=Phytophthora kernoviae TaxID=325452 RepID=A0A421F6T4_9STRA|nr:hypothetical protein BBI17_008016 [Phytophthora kernoviae]
MVKVSSSVSLGAVVAAASALLTHSAPLEYNPYTPVDLNTPLTASHPAYGAKPNDDCVQPIILVDPNEAHAEAMTVESDVTYRYLRDMEDASNSDMDDLASFFGTSLEVDFNTLKSSYAHGSAPNTPWPSSYWPTFQDGINHVWKSGDVCASEKYAKAYGLDVTDFKDKVSANNGIDSRSRSTKCSSNSDCSNRNDGSVCGKRDGASTGYCIPTWYGICHAWAPAALLEHEPKCDVEKNGVTFHVMDIKALLTDVYDGASISTVFTGARFNGPDSLASVDQYGRYTNAARRDLGAGFFHIAVSNIMGKHQQSFIMDVAADSEVWNQPVWSYNVQTMEILDTTEACTKYFGTSSYPFNTEMVHLAYVKTTLTWVVEAYVDGPLVSSSKVGSYAVSNDYEYVLELDANYAILGGEWVGDSKEDHPDFLWLATEKPAASTVTSTGLSYANVQELLELSLSCNSTSNTPTEIPLTSGNNDTTPTTEKPGKTKGEPTTGKGKGKGDMTPTPTESSPIPEATTPVSDEYTPAPTTTVPVDEEQSTPVPTTEGETDVTPVPEATIPTGDVYTPAQDVPSSTGAVDVDTPPSNPSGQQNDDLPVQNQPQKGSPRQTIVSGDEEKSLEKPSLLEHKAMVMISKSIALVAAVMVASTALTEASPLQYDPYTPVEISVPLTSSHPAYGAKVSDQCIKPIIPKDPNQPKALSLKLPVAIDRKLRSMEDAPSSDIQDLETYFGASVETNFNTLKSRGEASPSEKYAKAYGLDVTSFKNKVSAKTGVDSRKNSRACSTDSDCTSLNDGSVCAKRDGVSTGRCTPTWFGICHAWSPAAILEQEPQCGVTKNGVTFHVFDIKALLTYVYDGASIKTVFTGARFNGPDSPASIDQYGRYTNAARRDLSAGFFHIAIANIMGKQKKSFVVDVTAGAEVWNQPVRSYKVKQMDLVNTRFASTKYFGTPTYPFNDKMVRLAYVKTTFSWIVESYEDGPLVSTGDIDQYTTSRDYEYLLELDANNKIIGGEWVGNSKTDHPDFLWFPTGKPASSSVTGTGLSYANVQELLKMSLSCNALLPAIRVVQLEKSTASMPSVLPVLSMVANCVAWGLYGLLIEDYFPLVATNIVGISFSLFYLVVYYRHEPNKSSLRLQVLTTALLLLLLVWYPFLAEYMGEEEEDAHNLVGFVTVAISSVMFGSPLVLVKRVIQERNTELLPLAMIVAGAVNCVLWLAYGLLRDDAFVIVPNAANLLLGVVQLGLFCIFPRGDYDTVEKAASNTPGSKLKNGETEDGVSTTDVETDDEKSATVVETDNDLDIVDEEPEVQRSTSESHEPTKLEETTIEVH